jgi:hypothetical protein
MAEEGKQKGGVYEYKGKSVDVTKVPAGDIESAAGIAKSAGIDLELDSDSERTTMTPKVLVVVKGSK